MSYQEDLNRWTEIFTLMALAMKYKKRRKANKPKVIEVVKP